MVDNISKRGLIKSARLIASRQCDGDDIGINDSSNYSITMTPNEMRILDKSHLNINENSSFHANQSMRTSIGQIGSTYENSIMESSFHSLEDKTHILFPQFFEVLESRTNDSEVFDTIQDLIQVCAGVLRESQREWLRTDEPIHQREKYKWLEQEIKTWKLLYALYNDRILVQKEDQLIDYDLQNLGGSEKEVVAHLYNSNSILREYQLIIDWLEACYERRGEDAFFVHTTDSSVAWENTLHQLKRQQEIAFSSGTDIVKSLDPDAPIREKRPLHSLDEEDNSRLSRCIFEEVRQGNIDEAMALCKRCGQTWRAAILEGWRLHEDPNFENSNDNNNGEKIPIEGNPHRDIWKKCAWMMAESKNFDDYTRAIAGSFCGHLESMKSLLGNTWDDLLWAYLKVQVDIRVESEIRSCCLKPYYPLPEAYWNGKMSLEHIFDELMVHNDSTVRDYAHNKIAIIQKHFILDDVTELLVQMRSWIDIEETNMVTETSMESTNLKRNSSNMNAHMLRFFAHIVLFMRQIGRIENEENADHVIMAYVNCLIEMGNAQLVAFYTGALPGKLQISLYSKFLETVTETQARSTALEEALSAGLDVHNITRYTVETIRHQVLGETIDLNETMHIGDISEFDERKIKSLEWLIFMPTQRSELLWQGNAMIRTFLAENKVECVQAIYHLIPQDSISKIIDIYGSKDNLPCREECSIKEYLGYKVYLTAIDNFNDWLRTCHQRPKEPEIIDVTANFTERMAYEHKEQVYRAELNRWNISLDEQSNLCRDSLYNILLFPDKGWLVDPDTTKLPVDISEAEWSNRQNQLEKLRSICIPEIVLLLHKVLHTSGDYQGCVKLADEIAANNRKLYCVYTKHKLAELLAKFAESSLELLNKKLDPWGYVATI